MGGYAGTWHGSRGRHRRIVVKREQAASVKLLVYLELAALFTAFLASLLFRLERPYALALAVGAGAFAPFLKRAVKNERAERQKFCDVNSFMQQFISGMILHKRIAAALEEVLLTFPDGRMNKTVRQMLRIIRRAPDIREGEEEAFSYLIAAYPNPQLPLICDFAQRVERRGGEFETEMRLLSQKREKWEKRTEHCQNAMKVTAYSSVILYVTMILVCAMVQRMMPEELSVLDSPLAQIGEVLLILFFFLFLCMLMQNTAKGWMKREVCMDEAAAAAILSYLKKWNPQNLKGIHAGRRLFPAHRLLYYIRLRRIKKEIRYAVPRWLFDVCLLMQKCNITVSITESLKTAPPVLKADIRLLLDRLKRNPSGVDAYLTFLEEFHMESVKSTMRMLISIHNGAAGDTKLQMEQLIAHNMDMLDEIDARETELKDAMNVRYNIYPMIPGAVVMAGYLFCMVIRIFRMMSALI